MKQLITLICAICLCSLSPKAIAQKSPFNLSDSVRISGRIAGYSPSADDNYVTLTTYSIDGRSKRKSFPVNFDGTFDLKIYQAFEGDIEFSFKEMYKPLYSVPGGYLKLEVRSDDSPAADKPESIIVSGDLAEINNLIQQFYTASELHTFDTKVNLGDKSQTDSAFAAATMKLLDEKLTFLMHFITINNINSSKFKTWQSNHLMYSAGAEVLLKPFLGKLNTDITEKQLLFPIKDIPINNAAFCNSMYYRFLDRLAAAEQIIINISTDYDKLRASKDFSPLPLCLDNYDKISTGLSRQLLYHNMALNEKSKALESNYQRINSTVTDPYIKKAIAERISSKNEGFKPYNLSQRIKNAKFRDPLKQMLLTKLNSGNPIFIDFWGDWCGPCMLEMPNYAKLITAFDGKPIKFIFFSVSTSQKSMLAVKNKFGIKADFINLNNDETAIMNNILDFHSYPAHFLVNKTGEVLTNKFSQISNDSGLQFTKGLIRSLLKWNE